MSGRRTARRARRLCTAGLAAALAGCGVVSCGVVSHARGAGGLPTGPHRGRLTQVVYVNPLPGDPVWDQFGRCLTSAGRAHGIAVRTEGEPGGNVNFQGIGDLISQAVADHVQAIVTWSAGVPGASAAFAQERRQGGAVGVISQVGSSTNQNFIVGFTAAESVAHELSAVAKLPGRQRIGLIIGSGSGDQVPATEAFVAAHPHKLKLVAVVSDKNAFSNDGELAATMLSAHPSINMLINYSGFPGVLTAIAEHHLIGRVHAVTGSDYPRVTLNWIHKGVIALVSVYPWCADGRLMLAKLRDVWAGRPVKAVYDNGNHYVTPAGFMAYLRAGGT